MAIWYIGRVLCETENCQQDQCFHRKIVTQKYLTPDNYRITLILIANVLSPDKQVAAISALAEGSSIRSIDPISTSHIERLNATTELHMRRLTRLTLAFSKKREDFEAAVALHFAYYNFVKRHNTLRCTPAMAAGVERDFWTVGNLSEETA